MIVALARMVQDALVVMTFGFQDAPPSSVARPQPRGLPLVPARTGQMTVVESSSIQCPPSARLRRHRENWR